jgi:hypothetical protein
MALFGRDRLPARSTLSRFLAALDQPAVEELRRLFLSDLLARPRVERGATRRTVGPAREPLPRVRHRWHAGSCPPTSLTEDRRSASAATTLASPLCPRLHGAQTGGSRAFSHHGPPRAHASMARQLWQPRQWTVPGRIASRSGSDPALRPGPWLSRSSCHPAPGWPIWHGGGRLRSGRLLVCHTRQSLSPVGSRRGSGPFAPPS